MCFPAGHRRKPVGVILRRGSVRRTLFRRGLALARQLKAVLDAAVKALEADKALPEAVEVEVPAKVKNPFG